MMMDDMELVRRFAREGSEEAFEDLVSRHVNLVCPVAMRQARDGHVAEEVTQMVFVIFARKAASLASGTVVPGWLCRTARHVSALTLTQKLRRRQREQEAFVDSQSSGVESGAWLQIEPLLEGAMGRLPEKDHNAVVLRFFEGRDFRDIGATLGISEAGAKMRVYRALEKLRKLLAGRGLSLPSAMIAAAVSAYSAQAAPSALAESIATLSAQEATAASSPLPTPITTTLKRMAWTKLKTTGVIAMVAFAVGTATVTTCRVRSKAESSGFHFAGYATPEATFQSLLRGASTGDIEKFLVGFTTGERERFRKNILAGKSAAEIRRRALAPAEATRGYSILRREVFGGDEVHRHISAPALRSGIPSGQTIVFMTRIDGEWKRSGAED